MNSEINLEKALADAIAEDTKKIIVLDDDPTGTQTVHDISVYTKWSVENIIDGFNDKNKLFYILTNSRAMSPETTIKVHREIVSNIIEASKKTGKDFMIISRSDSTLRGHYPLETEVIRDKLREVQKIDGELICPFFLEGGRFTVDDIHYVKEGDKMTPASETEFAHDEVFGYTSSNLKEYIEEKTNGSFKAEDVISITLSEIRSFDIKSIKTKLMDAEEFQKVVVNAETYDDLKVFAVALYEVMKEGKRFIGRTAASIVKVLGGIRDKQLLSREELCGSDEPVAGIIAIGSYTEKSTKQLEQLGGMVEIEEIEINTDTVVDESDFENEIKRVTNRANEVLAANRIAVVYTGRKRICFDDDTKEEILARSVRISEGVQSVIKNLTVKPGFIIAKGGITSSDIATKAMQIECANVAGQIQPGIPVWKSKENNRYSDIPYIIFPGNVGEADTLKNIVEIFTEKRK